MPESKQAFRIGDFLLGPYTDEFYFFPNGQLGVYVYGVWDTNASSYSARST